MDRERMIENIRSASSSIKNKTYYGVLAAGGFGGVFFTVDGIMKGDKSETASGAFISAVTSAEVGLRFIQKAKKSKKNHKP